jgi:hypothetical protein
MVQSSELRVQSSKYRVQSIRIDDRAARQIEILLILALKSACMARPSGEVAQNRENYDPISAPF